MDQRRGESDEKNSANKKNGKEREAESSSKGESQQPSPRSTKKMNNETVRMKINGSYPPVPLPSHFKEKIQQESHGKVIEEEILLIQKKLLRSDLDLISGIFIIPPACILNEFLKDDKVQKIQSCNNTDHNGWEQLNHVDAVIIHPALRKGSVRLERRNKTRRGSKTGVLNIKRHYGLTAGWRDIVRDNNLTTEDTMQLWAVRVSGDLWFVLVNLTPTQEGNNSTNTTGTAGGNLSNEAKASSSSSAAAPPPPPPPSGPLKSEDGPNTQQLLPAHFKEKIQQESKGKHVIQPEILVIQKKLQKSDRKKGTFSIPSNLILNKFLNDDEEAILQRSTGKENYIDATIIDPGLKKGSIRLKRWVQHKKAKVPSVLYALSSGWLRIMTDNNLKEKDIMQLWAVRVGHRDLWFVLVNLTPGGNSSNAAKASSSSSSAAAPSDPA